MSERKIITIDGLAGSGKSSLAKELAKKTGFSFLSSGLIYRALGYIVTQEEIETSSEEAVLSCLDSFKIKLLNDEKANCLIELDGKEITSMLFAPEISEASSSVSHHLAVRQRLLEFQLAAFADSNLIAEGRDMGTVVFPNADLKVFLNCDAAVLAKRRLGQLQKKQANLSDTELKDLKSKLKIEITERNERDLKRPNSPTLPAKDALVIDNTAKTLTELLDIVYSETLKIL